VGKVVGSSLATSPHTWIMFTIRSSMVDFSALGDVSARGAEHALSSCQHGFLSLLLNIELHSRKKNTKY
jgi:hypothetical protein